MLFNTNHILNQMSYPLPIKTENKDLNEHIINIAYALQNYLQASQTKKPEEEKEKEVKETEKERKMDEQRKRIAPDEEPASKGSIVKYKPDWICPNKQCRNRNFAKRKKCNRCGEERPTEPELDFTYTSGFNFKRHQDEDRTQEKMPVPEKKVPSPGNDTDKVVSKFGEWFVTLPIETQVAISEKAQLLVSKSKGRNAASNFNPFECVQNPFLQK